MKRIFTLLLVSTSLLLFAQKNQPTTLPHHTHAHHGPVCTIGEPMPGFVVPAPAKKRTPNKEAVVFEVTYANNISPIVRQAFERATDILSDMFTSPNPISIRVNADKLDAGVLAFASPGTYLRNFRNAPIQDAWYPIALAEKIARREFNSSVIPFDIEVTYSNEIDWNFTSTGVGANQFDFVTVILHELMHGMGFSSLGNVSMNQGTFRLSGWQAAYSKFIENIAGVNLTQEIEDPSIRLGTEMRSRNLFMNTPSLAATDNKVKIYAPSIFSRGSSISHVDRDTYLGTPDGLMSPSINPGAIVHNPGISLDILLDLGWSYTSIIHEEGGNTENINEPYVITASIFSDNGYDPSTLEMHFSRDSFATEEILTLTPTGNSDEFSITIPAPGELTSYQYYFSVKDNRGLTFFSPSQNPELSFYEYFYAIDDTKPEIVHEVTSNLDDKSRQLIIEASVTDFFTGVNEVFIDYKINGASQEPVAMQADLSDGFRPDLYVGVIELPENGLNEGDLVEYRIVAIDKSPNRNTINNPEDESFHEVSITKTLDAINLYVNDFEIDDNEFNGQGFSIESPRGFTDNAIHSIHPYTNAGENNTRNFTYNLRLPIVVRKSEALIEFDEIVLVEPGEPNTVFSETEFWDYVIVEGRRTNSSTWRPFLDGYDSRANADWLTAYNSNIQAQNSQAAGGPSLYKPRTIDMQENGRFFEGDTVLIRFRLFSDPFAVGWGWAIDNLRIQDSPVAIEDFIENQDFAVFPNPVGREQLSIEAQFKQKVNEVKVVLSDISGKLLFQQSYQPNSQQFRQSVDIGNFAKGIYLLTLTMDSQEQITRRIIKQ